MSGNGYGNHTTTRDRLMAEHDQLHPDLRFLSCYTIGKWSADSFERQYHSLRRSGTPHRAAIAKTAAIIAHEEAKDTLHTYGPRHPEALPSKARSR